MAGKKRGIVAVACHVFDLTISMPAPARHGELLWALEAIGVNPAEVTQGFLDHRGLFLARGTAKIVASQWGQVTEKSIEDHPELFSEDLW